MTTALHLVRNDPNVSRGPSKRRFTLKRIEPSNMRWADIVTNLRGAGMSASGIARRVGMEPSTLSQLQSGLQTNPRWNQALALLDLHLALCPDKHSIEALRV